MPHHSTTSSSTSANKNLDPDTEAQKIRPKKASHWKLVFDQTLITEEVLNYPYKGAGTEERPYVVEFIPNDQRDPMTWSTVKKWSLTFNVAVATLAVSFVSSAYAGGASEIVTQFNIGEEVVTLGISLFVLGFAIGPLLWAPMSELFGRQILFFGTYAMLTVFNAGAAGSQNIQTLLILRFFAGAFGSSPLTNAGGVVADIFPASERGLGMCIFASAPFLGPTLGPIIGGFLGETEGWRWVEGLMAIFSGAVWIFGSLTIPETYSPVILRKRASKLSQMTSKVYRSKTEIKSGKKTASHEFKIALSRPWILLLQEPIVLLLSIYMAIIYGTLYMMFAAFPIVFQEARGWSPGIGGLAFVGVMIGIILGIGYNLWDNKRYNEVAAKHNNEAPPEARLHPAMVGSVCLPIGLFWFAWTNYPSIHWSVCIIGTTPFGFAMVMVFLSIMNYLIDAYVIYAASVLAANSVLRSLFGAVFPLFTTYMYRSLGLHWASSIPAFLALACTPFPFLFYKYGKSIRMKCKFAAAAAEELVRMRARHNDDDDVNEPQIEGNNKSKDEEIEIEDEKIKAEDGDKDERKRGKDGEILIDEEDKDLEVGSINNL